MDLLGLLGLLALASPLVQGDTPANCSFQEIAGDWLFTLGEGGYDNKIRCDKGFKEVEKYHVSLRFPNFALDENGEVGTWTMAYNQGLEVIISGRRFFAFSYYKQDGQTVESFCHTTFPGWVHNIDITNWRCFRGDKQGDGKTPTISRHKLPSLKKYDIPYVVSTQIVDEINTKQSMWRAVTYPEYGNYTVLDLIRRSGSLSIGNFPRTAPITADLEKAARGLPDEFDWRNVNGQNFVSPVRTQGKCGSCFAFGSMGMLESRLRIRTNNTMKKIFSTQDIVSCAEYSQGCDGGLPYLIAGKYGQDFGVIEESCFPYKGKGIPCKKTNCPRYFTTRDYYYVGGFYGACNELVMRKELVERGPIAVTFMAYPDLRHYKKGIYHHTGVWDKFDPYELTNHVVLIVGYGRENGQDYWTAKNSWGPKWGENGFFRIRRGNNECSIESMAVSMVAVG